MGKTITLTIDVPEDFEVEKLKEEIERFVGKVILMKEIEDIDVDEKAIDEIAEEIKKSGWEKMKKWLKL